MAQPLARRRRRRRALVADDRLVRAPASSRARDWTIRPVDTITRAAAKTIRPSAVRAGRLPDAHEPCGDRSRRRDVAGKPTRARASAGQSRPRCDAVDSDVRAQRRCRWPANRDGSGPACGTTWTSGGVAGRGGLTVRGGASARALSRRPRTEDRPPPRRPVEASSRLTATIAAGRDCRARQDRLRAGAGRSCTSASATSEDDRAAPSGGSLEPALESSHACRGVGVQRSDAVRWRRSSPRSPVRVERGRGPERAAVWRGAIRGHRPNAGVA